MRPFAALERFFERVFERPSARIFHARLQPIQLQRRVERAMENGRLSASDRVVVPNRYLVRLSGADLRGFGDFADSLELELADAALRFARAHRYTLTDRPAVRLVADNGVDEGDVRVDASFSDGAMAADHRSNVRDDAATPDVPSMPVAAAEAHALSPAGGASIPSARDAAPPAPAAPANPAPAAPAVGQSGVRSGGRPRTVDPIAVHASRDVAPPRPAPGPAIVAAPPPPLVDVTRTMVFEVPTVDAPVAVLREVRPDGVQRQLTLDGGPVTIGRATDNNLVLHDSRVSRYHGRLASRQGALVYRDLGSTNGSRVNGVEIDEVVLGAGDRLELGDTILVVESVAAD